MLPVAALLAVGGRPATWAAVALALAGGFEMLLFQGVGGRVHQDVDDPVSQVVWPLWKGDPIPPPPLWVGARFDRNLVNQAWPEGVGRLPDRWRWSQFLPLVAFQGVTIALQAWSARPRSPRPPPG